MRHRIMLLESTNIFVNLALEDTIYQHAALHGCNYLLIWRSSPCLVLGRHQNPWAEFNVSAAQRKDVKIARRNSGGGSVYHDLGNLNISFMTGRDQYNRRENLEFLTRVLERWRIPVNLSSRDDLLLNGHKISGTAAKLARLNAYHHCTLLFNADLKNIRNLLKPSFENIESKATESISSPVTNLGILNSQELIQSIVDEYRKWKEGQVVEVCNWRPEYSEFPQDLNYNTYVSSLLILTSWEWIFGKTPPFKVFHTFHNSDVSLQMNIERGRVKACILNSDDLPLLTEACNELYNFPARSSILRSTVERYMAHCELTNQSSNLGSQIMDSFTELLKVCDQFGS